MTEISSMFDCGENQLERLTWEFLDTPPAQAWQAAINLVKDDEPNPVENYFCDCDGSAEAIWDGVRIKLTNMQIKHKNMKYSYRKLTAPMVHQMIERVQAEFTTATLGNLELIDILDDLKNLSFWVNNGKDASTRPNESTFGTLRFNHYIRMEFDPEWVKYITHDIQSGYIYALTLQENRPYSDLAVDDFSSIERAIITKEFGPPSWITAGFEIPFFDEHTAVHGRVLENLVKYKDRIEYLDPTFDFELAIKSIGMVPVGKIKQNNSKRMALLNANEAVNAFLGNIKGVKRLKKIETYE